MSPVEGRRVAGMHSFRRFIEDEMHRLGMTKQADLVRASRLTRSTVSRWLGDERESIDRMPDPETISGLARAFKTTTERVTRVAAMSLDRSSLDEPVLVPTPKGVPDEELVSELLDRLRRAAARPAIDLLDIDALPDPKAGPQLLELHDKLKREARKDRTEGNEGLAAGKDWLASLLNACFAASVTSQREPSPDNADSEGQQIRH